MAVHSCILAWRIPWTKEPGGLHSMESQRVGYPSAIEKKKCIGETQENFVTKNIEALTLDNPQLKRKRGWWELAQWSSS